MQRIVQPRKLPALKVLRLPAATQVGPDSRNGGDDGIRAGLTAEADEVGEVDQGAADRFRDGYACTE